MKKLFLLLLTAAASSSGLWAQNAPDSLQLRPFLFKEFQKGTVLMKSGAVEQAFLNYNSDNQNIYFIKDDSYFILTGLADIDTIFIQGKKFVTVNDLAYEVLGGDPENGLAVSYTNKLRPMVATADNNGTARKDAGQVRNTISDNYLGRIYKGNFAIQYIPHFWLKKGTRLYKFDTEKQAIKLFWKKEAAIRNYVKESHIDFEKEEDIIRLFAFCNAGA